MKTRVIRGAHDEEAGIAAGKLLLGEEALPTAVLAGNDRCAVGLMDTLVRRHVAVPDEVSLGTTTARSPRFGRATK